MNAPLKRFLSLILAIVLCIILSVEFASTKILAANNTSGMVSTEKPNSEEASQEVSSITEITSLREEYVKHFDMGDGTYTAVAFPYPVHERDNGGNWNDINNTLQLDTTAKSGRYKGNQMGVSFARQSATAQPLLIMQDGSKEITLNFIPSQAAVRQASVILPAIVENTSLTAKKKQYKTIEDITDIDVTCSITYQEVLPKTDIEYVVGVGIVKENIIVKDSKNSYIYDFSLNLKGMYPILQRDGSINILNDETDQVMYIIPAPYMYDAMGNLSEDVWYTLSGDSGTYTLTVEASANWINDGNRTFPVTIDPSFVSGEAAGKDTFIDVARPTEIFGSRQSLWVRCNDTMITYMVPQSVQLPNNSILLSAQLQCRYYYYDYVTSGKVTARAYQVYLPWDESSFNYEIASDDAYLGIFPGDAGRLGTADAYGGYVVNNPGYLHFDVTKAAQSWIANPTTNKGVAIKHENGDNWSFAIRSYQSGGCGSVMIYNYRRMTDFSLEIHYDEYFKNGGGLSHLNNAEDFLNSVYDEFLIQFSTQSTLHSENMFTGNDNCSLGNQCSGHCGVNHCKDVYYTSNYFYNQGIGNREIVAFLCDNDFGTHCNHNNESGDCFLLGLGVQAIVFNHRPFVHILNIDNNAYEVSLALLLAHEIAHSFGMDDVYDEDSHKDTGPCIMDRYNAYDNLTPTQFYQQILSGRSPFCSSCAEQLNACINNKIMATS